MRQFLAALLARRVPSDFYRACIGAAFATMEMVLIVATILQRVRLALAPEQGDPEPLPLFSLRPRGGLQMTVAPRAAASSAGMD